MYVVEVCRNGNSALLYNMTVTVPQLDIAIPQPCDQYQATVTAVCGTTSGANNISLKFFGGQHLHVSQEEQEEHAPQSFLTPPHYYYTCANYGKG